MEPLARRRRVATNAAPNAPRNGALARIHVLKKECGLSDDEYRDLIQSLTNGQKRSAGDCDDTERRRIVAHLDTLKRVLAGGAHVATTRARKPLSGPQRKVFAVWKALESAGVVHSGEVRSLRAFVQRQTGLSAIEFCDGKACSTLIESLKAWAKRTGVELRS